MKKKWVKKTFKIVGYALLVLLLIFSFLLYRFTRTKSDQEVLDKFKEEAFHPTIRYFKFKEKKIRVIQMQKELDNSLPNLVFIHGSPGSGLDFKRYLSDSILNTKANLITYDRIGYGMDSNEKVLNSIDQEVEVLHQLIQDFSGDNTILIGYSYGGTIATASPKNYKSKLLLAPAIKGELEPMYWVLNLYKWKLTRPLIPNVFKYAAQEKIKHLTELIKFETKWTISSSYVTSIHGNSDRIVPYKNSLFLKNIFDKSRFELITIEKGSHALIWTDFDLIKEQIITLIEN